LGGVWSAGWIENSFIPISRPDATQREANKNVAQIQQFSSDDGHMDAGSMYRRVTNKYFKQN
jgi:hypothetical protein